MHQTSKLKNMLLAGICVAAISCKPTFDVYNPHQNERMTSKILLDAMEKWGEVGSKSNVYVDSVLLYRTSIIDRKKITFSEENTKYPWLSLEKIESLSLSLRLTESLLKKVKYNDGEQDVENGPHTFIFFSPLIPTNERGLYAIQIHSAFTIAEENISLRLAKKEYHLYRIKGKNFAFERRSLSTDDEYSLPLDF
jgi:hypothetical protein